ncbi:hypothetical protein CABS02_11237, partial [Colletotrichum abscissum]
RVRVLCVIIRRGPAVNGPFNQSELSGTEPQDITLTVVDKVLSASLVSFLLQHPTLLCSRLSRSPRRAVNGVFEASRPVLDTRPFAMDPNNGKANGPVRDGPPVRARECPPVQG